MIHQYKLNEYNIVLDTYSGSVHVVDDLAYEIIGLYENTPAEEIVTMMLEKYAHDSRYLRGGHSRNNRSCRGA